MATTEKTISGLISSELPNFINSDHPKFKRFIELYYAWLEQNSPNGISNTAGNTIYQAINIGDYRDIDQSPDEFITYFKQELLPYFPEKTALDLRKILKSAREFYSKKGSEESLKWLFKVLFDENIEITYPKDQILKTSDGKWKKPKAFRITVGETNKNVDVNLLKKKMVIGVDSGATCVIESANRTLDTDTGKEIIEIYISNIKRYFNNGEYVKIDYTDADGVDRVFLERIIGTISNVYIDSTIRTDPTQKRRGLLYNVGDPVVISGGLALTAEAKRARAIVANVSTGSIEAVTTVFRGYGYNLFSNTEVIVLRSNKDLPNANANTDLRVTSIDLTESGSNSQANFLEQISVDRSVIDYLESTAIGAANFTPFANNHNAELNVTEGDEGDYFDNFEEVWANGTNFYDALFTAKIATPNGNTVISGTVNVSSTSNVVTGLNTAFGLELKAGQQLQVAGSRRTIDAITNNQYLTTSTAYPSTLTAQTAFRIGDFAAQITPYTGSLLVYDIANTGSLSTILTGQQIYTKNTSKSFTFNSITTYPVPANANSMIAQCLDFMTLNTGGIQLISVYDGGAGFRNPSLLIKSQYDTILSQGYTYGNPNRTNTIQTFKDLGLICHVYIDNGGSNYSINDTITFSGRGYGGSAYVQSVDANGAITSIVLSDRGEGYLTRPSYTITTSGGTGAALTPYLFGDGFDYRMQTSAIGRIKDIKLLYRGYDYISKPEVSLKVVDTIINPIGDLDQFVEKEYVYQGASFSTSTFRANVGSYDRTTNLLRLYNYSGSLNTTIDLISANGLHCTVNTSVNVAAPIQYPSSVIATGLPNPMVYGDGKAKANVVFANGLIEFNGFYLNSDGFLSADKVLQDGHIYHNFSYMIQSNKDLAEYKSTLKNIAHPSGLIPISKRIISSEFDAGTTSAQYIHYVDTAPGSNIQIQNSYSNVITGNSTTFLTGTHVANVGDLFMITDTVSPLRSISKTISSVDSDTQLKVYGDFIYVGQGKVSSNQQYDALTGTVTINPPVTGAFTINPPITGTVKVNAPITGSINVTALSSIVAANTSNGTAFTANLIANDIIVVNNQIRKIISIPNNSYLIVNAPFIYGGTDNLLYAKSNTVIGTGTTFNTNIAVGDLITINGEIRQVVNVNSDTLLNVNSQFTNYATGAQLYTQSNVVIGSGGNLDPQVNVGDIISINNEIRKVTVRGTGSDDYLEVNSVFNFYGTGLPLYKQNTTILGSGTNFSTVLAPNNIISVNNQIREVIAVTDATHIVVNTPFAYYETGNAISKLSNTVLTVTGATNAISDFIQAGDDVSFNIAVANVVKAQTGTVQVFTDNAKVIGTSTNFTANLKANDIVMIANQMRRVINIASTTVMNVNSAFVSDVSGEILYKQATTQRANVVSISGNTLTLNIAYNANVHNLVYQIAPDYSSADYDYKIVTMTAD